MLHGGSAIIENLLGWNSRDALSHYSYSLEGRTGGMYWSQYWNASQHGWISSARRHRPNLPLCQMSHRSHGDKLCMHVSGVEHRSQLHTVQSKWGCQESSSHSLGQTYGWTEWSSSHPDLFHVCLFISLLCPITTPNGIGMEGREE